MQASLSMIVVLMIALIAVLVISAMLGGGFTTLEEFGSQNIGLNLEGI